jgi:hypothetical protein
MDKLATNETDEPREALTSALRPKPRYRSFFSGTVRQFLATDPSAIVGQLSSRHVAFHRAAEAKQVRAWEQEIALLRAAFAELGDAASDWSLLLEIPLLRLAKRLDAVVLAPGVVGVLEFKIGASTYEAQDRAQVERYAQCLRDFHEASQIRKVIPILCADQAPDRTIGTDVSDGVGRLILANKNTLAAALALLPRYAEKHAQPLSAEQFENSPYRPTPTIIEAAQELYTGHEIADIGRGDAADAELQIAAATLQRIAAKAEAERLHVVCFVTGAPGAGKTLLGLDLALKFRSGTSPAALLSGNRPLVHVLTEALAIDRAALSTPE